MPPVIVTVFVYKYDPGNRLTNRCSIAKGGTIYRYDAVGNLTNAIYPVCPSISLAYDVSYLKSFPSPQPNQRLKSANIQVVLGACRVFKK